MPNVVRIKRRAAGGAAGAPASLQNAELAFNEQDNTLYYGFGTGGAGGSATNVVPIAGKGAFADLTSNQTIAGTKTFSSVISGSIDGGAAKWSTARTETLTGDVTGSATVDGSANWSIATTLANSGVTAGTYTKVTVDAKGRVTVGAALASTDLPTYTGTLTSTQVTSGLGYTPLNPTTSQSANLVYAAPNGAAGAPTFRALVAADIPILNQNTTGSAAKWTTARTETLTGDVTGSATVDGSANWSIATTLANSGVTAGTYTKITVDAKGRATVGAQASLTDLSSPTAAFSMGGQVLTNLADPVNAQDAATKNYVDTMAQGLDAKASVRAATTGNITLSGAQTIDGVALVAGDRVLVKNQTTASQNGIYVVAAGAWSRSTDAASWNSLVSAFTFVESGTANSDTGWTCTVDPGGTLGTTAISFTQFSSAGSYTAGNGLALAGGVFSAVGTANRITVSAGGIDIASTYAGQTSITTLGTITTGVWQGTAIAVGYGGLGLTSAVTGLLKGNGTAYSAAVAGTDYLDPNSTIDGGTF